MPGMHVRRAERNDHNWSLRWGSKNTTSNTQKWFQKPSKSLPETLRMQENALPFSEALRKQSLLTGTPMKVAKGHPKGSPKHLRGRLQPVQNASKAPPRRLLEMGNLENLIFEGCIMRNHKFWKCQGAPKTSILDSGATKVRE